MLNFHSSVPSFNSTFLMNQIRTTPSFTGALDSLASHFEVSSVTQSWTTLNVQSDKSFNISAQNNFLTVYDYIQKPMNNLAVNYNASDFSFPIAFDYLTAPLANVEIQFTNFISNALYVTIPNF
jgi:hypothetical protein